jgi:hypothetical protein
MWGEPANIDGSLAKYTLAILQCQDAEEYILRYCSEISHQCSLQRIRGVQDEQEGSYKRTGAGYLHVHRLDQLEKSTRVATVPVTQSKIRLGSRQGITC